MIRLLGLLLILTFSMLAYSDANIPTQTKRALQEIHRWVGRTIWGAGKCTWHMTSGSGKHKFLSQKQMGKDGKEFRIFDVLKFKKADRYPHAEAMLPFYNGSSSIDKICKTEFGVCAGFSYFYRTAHMGAIWDKNNKFIKVYKNAIPDKVKTPEKYIKFYRSKIRALMKGKPQVIPGFGNLKEFGSDEIIAKLIQTEIVSQWARINVSIPGIKDYLLGVRGVPTPKEMWKLLISMRYKTGTLGYNPIIVASGSSEKAFSKDQWIHVLQVTKVENMVKYPDGMFKTRIHVWDPNDSTPQFAIGMLNISFTPTKKMPDGRSFDFADSDILSKSDFMLDDKMYTVKIDYNGHDLADIEPIKWDELYVSDMAENLVKLYSKNPELLKLMQ